MKYLFTIFFWLTFSLLTIFLGCLILILSFFLSDKTLHKIGIFWGKVTLKLAFVKVNYIEMAEIDKNDVYIIMPNHQSAFDIFTLFAYLPVEFRWLSKDTNFKIPFLGWAMKVMNEISVDRGNIKELKNTLSKMENCLNRGISLVIFPEGTRSYNGEILPFKKGGFFLALKTKKKILPVGIWGTKDVMKRGSFVINPFKTICVVIGEPIELNEKDRIEIKMEKLRNILINLTEKAKNSLT